MTRLRAAFFGDYPHQLAGAAKSLLAAILDARERGRLDPVVVLPTEGIVADACRAERVEVAIVRGPPAYDVFGKALLRLSPAAKASVFVREVVPYAFAFARWIEGARVDVVHFNTARGTLLAGLGAHLAGRASVLHVRGMPRYDGRLWALAQAASDEIILVARALERDLLPSVRARAHVVHDGVADKAPIPRARARDELVGHGIVPASAFARGPVFVSLSSFVPFKGLHHLAHAVAGLGPASRGATFLLAGASAAPTYEAWLKRLVDRLGIGDRVHFLGFLREPHLLLSGADALVLPSVEHESLEIDGMAFRVDGNEGLPHSILEAMRAGIPSIASDVAGVREEIEDGETGFVVAPGDPGALGAAIERLSADASHRESMGARARTICRLRFPVETASSGLVDVLERAHRRGTKGSGTRAIATVADALRRERS